MHRKKEFTAHLWLLVCLIDTAAMAATNSVLTRYLDFGDTGQASLLAADGTGNLFAVGLVTEASGLPQIRVIKTDPNGNPLASLDFGGSLQDTVAAAATDAQGNLVIIGSTQSPDFPLVAPLKLQARTPAAFVVKIDAQLQHIVFSTLLGGMNGTFASGNAVAVDAKGNLYVAGSTDETDFPITAGAFQSVVPSRSVATSSYAFVTEISSQEQIVYSTYYSGTKPACTSGEPAEGCLFGNGFAVPTSIRVDSAGNIVIAGITDQADLPTTAGAYSQHCACSQAGFVAKLAAGGSSLVWATLVPPNSSPNSNLSITTLGLESDGSVVAAGNVIGGLAVTAGVVQPEPAGGTAAEGFVVRINATGSGLVFASYLGAEGSVVSLAIDAQGAIWLTGSSTPASFPGVTSLGPAYTVSLAEDGSRLASVLTAPADGAGRAIAVTPQGGVATLGASGSLLLGDLAQAPSLLGVSNSAATRVSGIVAPLELVSLYGIGIGPSTPFNAQIVNTGPGGQQAVTNALGGIQVLFNGVAAPLLYAGPSQINAVVPLKAAAAETTTVQIVTAAGTIAGPTLRVRPSRPQVFGSAPSGVFFAAALNQDGTINSHANPAAIGSIVTVWATGAGLFSPGSFRDGTILNAGGPVLDSFDTVSIPLPVSVLAHTALPGLDSAQVLYAGAAPNDVQGVIQIDFALPANPSPQFQLQVGSALSDPFYIWVPGLSVAQ
jgi:uncharacterized protein (TIGR03437 family)